MHTEMLFYKRHVYTTKKAPQGTLFYGNKTTIHHFAHFMRFNFCTKCHFWTKWMLFLDKNPLIFELKEALFHKVSHNTFEVLSEHFIATCLSLFLVQETVQF